MFVLFSLFQVSTFVIALPVTLKYTQLSQNSKNIYLGCNPLCQCGGFFIPLELYKIRKLSYTKCAGLIIRNTQVEIWKIGRLFFQLIPFQ